MSAPFKNNVVFFHIPKAAGTTVWRYFQNVFGKERSFLATPEALNEFEACPLEGRFFSAHMNYTNYEAIKTPHKAVTFFRDPKQRLLSTYYFLRAFRLPEGVKPQKSMELAKTVSLGKWLDHAITNLDDPDFRDLDNFYIRVLLGRQLSTEFRRINCDDDSSEILLARHRIRQFHAVGIVENFDASLAMFARSLGLPAPGPKHLRPENTFAQNTKDEKIEKELISDEFFSKLEELTRGDQKIYNYAAELSGEQIRVFDLLN